MLPDSPPLLTVTELLPGGSQASKQAFFSPLAAVQVSRKHTRQLPASLRVN